MKLRKLVNSGRTNISVYIDRKGDILINEYIPVVFGNIDSSSISKVWNDVLKKCWDKNIVSNYIKNINKQDNNVGERVKTFDILEARISKRKINYDKLEGVVYDN